MKQTILILKTIHRIVLSLLFILLSIVPFCYQTSITTSFVLIPSIFIGLSFISIFIESTLTSWSTELNKTQPSPSKQHNKVCRLLKGVCC